MGAASSRIIELRAAAARYRALVESTNDLLWEVDAAGRYTYCSPNVRSILGYDSDAILGRTPFELMPAEEAARVGRIFVELAKARRPFELLQHAVRHADGTLRVIECSGRPVLGPDGALLGYRGVDRDITDRHEAERAFREAQQRYAAVFESATDAIVSTDDEGRIVAWNPAAERMFGRGSDEMLGASVTDIMPERFRAAHLQGLERLRAGAPPRLAGQLLQLAGVRADGTEFPLELTLSTWRATERRFHTAILRDVSARVQAEAELRQSELRFRRLLEHAGDSMAVFDRTGRFLDVNQTACEAFGYTRPELLALSVPDIEKGIPPEEIAHALEALRPGAPVTLEGEARRKDGTRFPVEVRVGLVDDAPGAPILALVRDVTERRRVEAVLRERDERRRQQHNLEALGQLAAGVAHDFNNALTGILGFVELCLRSTAASDPRRDDLEQIRRSGVHAAELTRQLLAFSRQQVLQPAPVELNALIADTEPLLRRLADESIDIRTELAPNAGVVLADRGQLAHVLMNLVANARDAMPGGGVVTLATAREAAPDGHWAVVTVRDTGQGMDAETRRRAFEPFFTTKPVGKGTGLGLSSAYGTVTQSGGTIDVRSEPGRGTTITIRLPSHGPSQPTALPAAAPPPSPPVRGTVLVAEDDGAVRDLVARVVRGAGCRCLVAADGARALAMAREQGRDLDLLVTDLVMPGVNGWELAEQFRALQPRLRVLFITGWADTATLQHARSLQGACLLRKPFTPAQLEAAVRRQIEARDAA